MSYVTVAELKKYTGRYTESGDDTMIQGFLSSAEETVKQFLGYAPADFSVGYGSLSRIQVMGDGSGTVQLPFAVSGVYGVCPVDEAVPLFTASNPEERWATDWSHALGQWLKDGKNIVEHPDGSVFTRGKWYEITYIPAFWPSVPEKIRTVTLELASLYWEAANGNLAVTSTSFADQGTRVFQNFTAEDKYLRQIESWRVDKSHVSRWRSR